MEKGIEIYLGLLIFRISDLLPILNFKKIEEYLIFETTLGLKGQRCWHITSRFFLELHVFS